MNGSDVRKVKRLANRLGVRDSDVIRYAVKTMLMRLDPLVDPTVSGRALLPVFVESGGELVRYFDLDASNLEAIINDGAEASRRVEREDVSLLAMTSSQQPYVALKLSELQQSDRPGGLGTGWIETLREYLYAKYLFKAESLERRAEERHANNVVAMAVGGARE
jgi:hypothetical protein